MPEQASGPISAAIEYAQHGWPVFPVESAPGKRPLIAGGFHAATTDPEVIASWWAQWPNAQIGMPCDKVVIVDLDDKPHEGINGQQSLEAELGAQPHGCGLVMSTPRGNGRQMFYRNDDGLARRLGVLKGVDILGNGGYTILPGPSSPGRDWIEGELDDIGPMPQHLARLCKPTAKVSSAGRSMHEHGMLLPQVEADILAAIEHIPNDDRDDWIKVGMALKSTGAGDRALQIWLDWSMRSNNGSATHPKFNEKDQVYQWHRLAVRFSDGHEISLRSLFAMAQTNGWANDTPTWVEEQEAADVQEPARERGPGIEMMDWQDVLELPPIEWIVENYLPKRSISFLAASTQAGKTFYLVDLAMRVVHGMPVNGAEVEAGSVLFFVGEGQEGLAARLRAWETMNPHREDKGHYCLVSSEIPELGPKTMGKLEKLIDNIVQWKGAPPSVIIFDTLSQGLVGDENDAQVVAPVIRGLANIRRIWGCTVLLSHHLVKMGQQGKVAGRPAPKPTLDSVRGNSALTRNVDTVLGLTGGDDSAARELVVWKQRDGPKPQPVTCYLHQCETGMDRQNGQPETSCIWLYQVRCGWISKEQMVVVDGDSHPSADRDAARALEFTERLNKDCARIAVIVAECPGINVRNLRLAGKAVGLTRSRLDDAVDVMLEEGSVAAIEGPNRQKFHEVSGPDVPDLIIDHLTDDEREKVKSSTLSPQFAFERIAPIQDRDNNDETG